VVEKGENSTDAMRESQDPWLYSSVVSSDYDEHRSLAYTSSFDHTVKVWSISPDDRAMEEVATWQHQGNVNFVVTSKYTDQYGAGYVATASDIPSQAVRIYQVNPADPAQSQYIALSCSRQDANNSDKWAYYPSTMQWGKAPGTEHILAIGYSPRALNGDDHDIPEDRRRTGEVVLWNAQDHCIVGISNATGANVFEVAWHPTLRCLLVATAPVGLSIEPGVKTQIHLFQPDKEFGNAWFSEFQNLDCPASDINEITIIPNSGRHAYVTAACTDGNVYVWDTAQGDRPIHVLSHGDPVDEFIGDREREDTGVKFTAWGRTPDRLYTGGSDGVVKVWNVRNTYKPFVRDLLQAPGPISCGAFSGDYARLAIGDATGRVFLLSTTESNELADRVTALPGMNRRVRIPQPFTPHPDPPAAESDAELNLGIKEYAARRFLHTQQLVLHPNPVVGAVQGPAYPSTNLFRHEAHAEDNAANPLRVDFVRLQQYSRSLEPGSRRASMRRTRPVRVEHPAYSALHTANAQRDLDPFSLEMGVIQDLIRAGADLTIGDEGWDFAYEESFHDEDEDEDE
jgi:WD40 repeat protein